LMAAGSLVGALAASSCCILPLVLFGLDVTGAWIGNFTRLAPYQRYFIAVTIGCLGYGYWLVYRSTKLACADGDACARACRIGLLRPGSFSQASLSLPRSDSISSHPCSSTHERRIAVSKLLASAAIAVSILASSTALAAEKTITLAVKNMYCADCPFIVRKSLEAVPGVTKAVVSYKDKTAVVTYDDTRADVAALTRATTEAGYPSAPRS
jgi:mercuric transport protein